MHFNTLELYPGGPVILNGHPLEWVINVDVDNIGTLDTMEATLRIAVSRVDIHHNDVPVPMVAEGEIVRAEGLAATEQGPVHDD